MLTIKTLHTIDQENLSHLTKYDDGCEPHTLMVLVGNHYLPLDDAADILKSQLVPHLLQKFYENKLTISQANKRLHALELQYPSTTHRYYVSSDIRDHF